MSRPGTDLEPQLPTPSKKPPLLYFAIRQKKKRIGYQLQASPLATLPTTGRVFGTCKGADEEDEIEEKVEQRKKFGTEEEVGREEEEGMQEEE